MNNKGDSGEEKAVAFLKKNGLKIIQRNFSSKYGEIDIIAQEDETLCFVEVRTRALDHFGLPQETVRKNKQKKIIKTAQWYLQRVSFEKEPICRFDVIAILSNQPPEWIKDAFSLNT